jgi:hypothetical protein
MLRSSGLAVLSLALSACAHSTVVGSGQVETKGYPSATDFDQVRVGHAFDVEIVQGEQFAVQITADDNLFEAIEVATEKGELTIALRDSFDTNNGTRKAVITMPELRGLRVSGASNVRVGHFSSKSDIALQVSGASDVKGRLEANALAVTTSGASRVRIAGAASHCSLIGSGASSLILAEMACETTSAKLSGSSSASVKSVEAIGPIALSGASSLSYTGEPRIGDVNVKGGSSLRRR